VKPKVRSASELVNRVANDPKLEQSVRDNPVETLARLAAPLDSDVWIYRMVVGALGLAVLLTIVGLIWLTLYNFGNSIPDGIVAIGSAAVGALAGLLAPSPASRRGSDN
jgi:hypothetical protein